MSLFEPLGEDPLVETIRLALVQGVGPKTRQALLERFQQPAQVFAAAPSELRTVQGVGPKLARRITAAVDEIDVASLIATCRAAHVEILTENDSRYPTMLGEIDDPPGVLFVRGGFQPQDALAVAIVGTRHATRYGLDQAERLAYGLAKAGLTVISGLARGIDAAAHRGALAAGGRTLAILGSGVLNVYPPEHRGLADSVAAQGAVVSEAWPDSPPLSGAFPQRNRIISGLSLGVLVVEAGQRSGALITARHAMEQNRDVFAVPGPVTSRASQGCHQLIRDGATLVETVDDILEHLGHLPVPVARSDGPPVHHPAELQLNDVEQKVLAAIGEETTSIDQLVAATGLPVQRVLSAISVLEMRRLVRRLSGVNVARI